MLSSKRVAAAYRLARESYASYGVDSDAAIERALEIPISLHCWQADDVRGLETPKGIVDNGGIMATGAYRGRARNGPEIRDDLGLVLKLLPGIHRLNLHAFYAETGSKAVDRDELEPKHFSRWLDWAKRHHLGIDFNPSYFAHPLALSGATLSHSDPAIRKFWIAHARACRGIAQHFAKALGTSCIVNHWVPDGSKDLPADRWSPRKRLADSYDAILADRSVDEESPALTPSRESCSESEARASSSARRSSIRPMRWAAALCRASTLATTIRPNPSPTRSPRSCRPTRGSSCTPAGRCAGTATTSSSSTTPCRDLFLEIARGNALGSRIRGARFF